MDGFLQRLESESVAARPRRTDAPPFPVPDEYWLDYPECRRGGCGALGELRGWCPDHAPAAILAEFQS